VKLVRHNGRSGYLKLRLLSSIGFQKESSKNQIAIMIKLLAILVPFVAIYWQDLDLVFREALFNDFMSYILVIPFLVGYIIYRKRKILKAISPLNGVEPKKTIWTGQIVVGITLLTISFLIYFFGSYTSQAFEYHLLSLPLFLAASVVLVFNLETLKALLFPIALLFFIQPYLIQLLNPFWSDLSWISSTAAYQVLSVIGIPVEFTTVLEVPTINVTTINGDVLPFTVGVASSGLNSFMGFTVFSIFVVYILREPLWKRITLMLTGYPLLLLLNTLRITIILSLAYQWGMAVAEAFHLTGGIVLIFIGTVVLLFIGEKIWKVKMYPNKFAPSNCTYCDQSFRNSYNFCMNCGKFLKSINHVINRSCAMKMAFLLVVVLLFILVHTPPIVLATSPTDIDLTQFSPDKYIELLPTIPDWDLQFLYRDNRVESILRQDAALMFAYASEDNGGNSSYAYVFVGVQISTGWHTWEGSLITWPTRYGRPTATVLDLRDVRILQDPALTGRFFAYQRPGSNRTEVVLYWGERVPFKIASVWDMRNVQISIISYTDELAISGLISSPNDLAGVEKLYLPFAQSIANYWQPIKASSLVTTLVSQDRDKILIPTCILLTGTNILYVLEKRREKRANTNAYKKLSEHDKRLINLVHETEKTTKPTLNAIASRYQNITTGTIDKEKLLQELVEAEKNGLIKSKIISLYDEPTLTWRTQIDFKKI